MASTSSFPLIVVLLITVSLLSLHTVECSEFDVGGDKGWATPSSKNQLFYNDWASKNRFKVNDTLKFVYKKDSVMVVRDEKEYDKCQSTLPLHYFNNGSNLITLDHPGLFYFISGVATHCEKGLKMIVKVLEPELQPPPPASDKKSAATAVFATPHFVLPLVASLVGLFFI